MKRAIYYCGRMLSAQYGSVFTQSHYGEIQKVYSIWICTRPPKERENTITSYTLQERHLVGHVTEPVRNYDLMNVTMICLGKPEGKRYGGLLRMLEVLFTGRYAAKEVIQILEDEYEFAHAHTMERTVSSPGWKEKPGSTRPRPQNRTNRSRRLSPRRRNPAKIRPTEANPIVANPARLHPVVIVVSRPAEASPVAMDLLAVNPQAIHQLQNRLKQSPL